MSDVKVVGSQFADWAMNAAAAYLRTNGIKCTETQAVIITNHMRASIKEKLASILEDGKVILDGGHNGWLQTHFQTSFAEIGINAVKASL